MDKAQLKQKLSQQYNPENWKEILQYIFPNVSLFQIPQEIPVANDLQSQNDFGLDIGPSRSKTRDYPKLYLWCGY